MAPIPPPPTHPLQWIARLPENAPSHGHNCTAALWLSVAMEFRDLLIRGGGGGGRDALEGKGPHRRSQKRLDRRLEEVAKAAGGGYCRLHMPLRLAFSVRKTVAGHRLGALEGGGGYLPPLPMHPWGR